jgi:hypothetical protein
MDPRPPSGVRAPYVLGACVAVVTLPVFAIWGLVMTLGPGPGYERVLGPAMLALAVGGAVALFRWARRQRGSYGLEESRDGDLTPRWYIRAALLVGIAWATFAAVSLTVDGHWLLGLAFFVPFAAAAAHVFRPRRLRPVRPPRLLTRDTSRP